LGKKEHAEEDLKRVSTAVLAAAIAGIAAAQGTLVYAPIKAIKDQNITVKGWGSGTISETDETAYEGTHSIRISSRNFFQGGISEFEKGLSLAEDFQDKANLLNIVYRTADGSTINPGGPGPGSAGPGAAGPGNLGGGKGGGGKIGGSELGGGGPGGPPGKAGGAGGGIQGGPGGLPGGPQGGIPGRPGGPGQQAAAATGMETLRMIITTTDGKKSEAYVPLTTGGATAVRGWSSVAVPLAAISGFDRTNKIIKSVAFAPDDTSTFYIGELKVMNDTTPIRGEISPISLNLGVGQEVRLTARGSGGASILKYTWDFDDEDGVQVDAEGQQVIRKFRKPGTYNITLTISDYFGTKQPYTTKIKAVIN
jgi:hypothetical protein